jgi:hypothetical protein
VVGVRLPLVATWGAQLDVRPIGEGGELSAERVAGYVAKYATKGAEAAGAALDHRLSRRSWTHWRSARTSPAWSGCAGSWAATRT